MKTKAFRAIRTFASFLALLSSISFISSCEHKDLCYHHDHYTTFRVEYDWRDAPEADPAGMALYFYPEDGGSPIVYQFTGKDGGEITVPQGRYKLLTYNNDTSGVQFSDADDYSLHTAFTRTGGLFEPIGMNSTKVDTKYRAEGTDGERVAICPDMMWGCNAIDVDVNEQGVSYICVPESEKDQFIGQGPIHTEYVVTLYPHELTCIYTYEIRNVTNLHRAVRMSASLSGMAPSLQLFHEKLGTECVTLPFEAFPDHETNRIIGRFITFGHHEENLQPHKMVLYIWTIDGKAYVYGTTDANFNVTDQVHKAPNKRRVHIIIDRLDIPGEIKPDPTPGGGFQPGIDDLPEINFDIII